MFALADMAFNFCMNFSACRDPADVVFAIDASGSVGKDNFYTVLDFTKDLVMNMNIGQTRVAFETFANNQQLQFNLNSHETRDSAVAAISFPYRYF